MGARHDLVGHKLAALSINLNIVKVHLLLDGLAQSDSFDGDFTVGAGGYC
jgi:hypothetical protein